MAADQHHVIIGNGVAGVRAATVLRERDPDNRITIISIGGLLFSGTTGSVGVDQTNNYLLPSVAATVIGGTSILGGTGGYFKTGRWLQLPRTNPTSVLISLANAMGVSVSTFGEMGLAASAPLAGLTA